MRGFIRLSLALAIGLSAAPALALDPYPGETREAFLARAELDRQEGLAGADRAAALRAGGSANALSSGGARIGLVGLIALGLAAFRWTRRLFRVSQGVVRIASLIRPKPPAEPLRPTFDHRLAQQLRALEQRAPADAVPSLASAAASTPMPPRMPAPAPSFAGPRTFGRRAS